MRETIHLECLDCTCDYKGAKKRNYTASRNKKIKTERMEVRKYCRWGRKHTLHKEVK
ncbi:MAG: 50S ribosomal protein L33 [bacterium]